MNKKILTVAEAVSNEKCLPKEKIFKAIESALEIATKKKHHQKIDVRVSINRNKGTFNTYRRWMVVKKIKQPTKEITLEAAIYKNKNIKIGDFIELQIKSIIFDRITTQIAKQVVAQKMREAKRKETIKILKKKTGQIIDGMIQQINKKKIIIDIGSNLQAWLYKKDMIPQEKFKRGNRIKAVLYKIKKIEGKYHILLSRTKKKIIIELLKTEIPEIKEKIIKIKSIARNPGYRTKIAVTSKDKYIDPIGACIGLRGSRIKAISDKLSGEKIDIILWNKNNKKFVINSLLPAKISYISENKNQHTMNIIVKENKLAQTIGKKGRNIRLASKLTGWNINILSLNKNKYK